LHCFEHGEGAEDLVTLFVERSRVGTATLEEVEQDDGGAGREVVWD